MVMKRAAVFALLAVVVYGAPDQVTVSLSAVLVNVHNHEVCLHILFLAMSASMPRS